MSSSLVKGALKLVILVWRHCGQGQIGWDLDLRAGYLNERVISYIWHLRFFKVNIARLLMCSGELSLASAVDLFSRQTKLWYDYFGDRVQHSRP